MNIESLSIAALHSRGMGKGIRKLGPNLEKALLPYTPIYKAIKQAGGLGPRGELRIRAVAEKCKVSHQTLYAWMKTGKLPDFAPNDAVVVLTGNRDGEGHQAKEDLINGLSPEVLSALRKAIKGARK